MEDEGIFFHPAAFPFRIYVALHFVQDIDDVAFLVGKYGFLTRPIQNECIRVTQIVVPKGRKRVNKFTRRIFTISFLILLLVPYGVVVSRQWHGVYVCQNIYVQFGDAYFPELGKRKASLSFSHHLSNPNVLLLY